MADIALGSVGKIVEVGFAIKEAVETVQQNKEDCHEIQKLVLRVTGIIKQLEEMRMMDNQAMSDALVDLEETLRRTLMLVMACQERHVVCLFCNAGDLSKQLRRVQDDIMQKMMLGVFATNVHITIILTNIECAPPPPPQPQDTGVVEIPHSSHSAIDSRIETEVKENNVPAGSDTPFASLPAGLTKFSLSVVRDATNNFSQERLIGRGAFAEVYKGILQDGQEVAIKRFQKSQLSFKQMENELRWIYKFEHKNIAKCLGYSHEGLVGTAELEDKKSSVEESQFSLVEEYMPNGDLERINYGRRADWSSRFQLIQGIAQGVKYLHEQSIIHMDLKPSNILLESDMNAKITDFGVSRMLDVENEKSELIGTLGYMAPEYFYQGRLSFKADVYAFGVILLGTISGMCKGDPPRGAASVEWAIEVRDRKRMKELFDPTLLDESQLKGIKMCMEIGLQCVGMERDKRPTMDEVIRMLDSIKNAETLKKNPSVLRRLVTLTS